MAGQKVTYIFVHGTGSQSPSWMTEGSPLRSYLSSLGWEHYKHPDGMFRWSGEIGMLLWGLNRKDWEAGADSLAYYVGMMPEPPVIITHSHGAQLVVRAAASGKLTVPVWIDVCGPIRGDTLKLYPEALPRIGQHIFIHDASRWGDRMRLAGQLFDLSWGFPLVHPYAHNIAVEGHGHSGCLKDPKLFSVWDECNDYIQHIS